MIPGPPGAFPISFEMLMLLGAVALGVAQMLLAAGFARRQYGLDWAAGARDEPVPPLFGVGGRTQRAFANFMESFAFFAALALAAEAMGRHNAWTSGGAALYLAARLIYLPLYAFGAFLIRSLVWTASMAGIALIAVGLFQAS